MTWAKKPFETDAFIATWPLKDKIIFCYCCPSALDKRYIRGPVRHIYKKEKLETFSEFMKRRSIEMRK